MEGFDAFGSFTFFEGLALFEAGRSLPLAICASSFLWDEIESLTLLESLSSFPEDGNWDFRFFGELFSADAPVATMVEIASEAEDTKSKLN